MLEWYRVWAHLFHRFSTPPSSSSITSQQVHRDIHNQFECIRHNRVIEVSGRPVVLIYIAEVESMMQFSLLSFVTLLCLLVRFHSSSHLPDFPFLSNSGSIDASQVYDFVTERLGTTGETLHDKLPKTSTGTTIVGICCRDGVVLGSDTRSTGGSVVMDKNVLKIHYIAPSIRCAAAGTSADCEYLSNEARRVVALNDIDCKLAGDSQGLGNVHHAVESIMKSLTTKVAGRGKPPSAVFIVGGVDQQAGAQLYQIEADGTPQRLPFASLGSGSLDALSILENACRKFKIDTRSQSLDMSMEEATNIVRKAVQAGILNDLGSGSHVDLCCIEGIKGQVHQWREHMVNRWPMPKAMDLDTRPSITHNNDQLGSSFRDKNEHNMDNEEVLGTRWKPSKSAIFRSITSSTATFPVSKVLYWTDETGLVPQEEINEGHSKLFPNNNQFREISVDIL